MPKTMPEAYEPAREQRKVPIPRDLLEALKDAAAVHHRSMVGEIRWALAEHIRRFHDEQAT